MAAKVLKGLIGISIPQAVENAALQDPKRRALMVNMPEGEPLSLIHISEPTRPY